MALGRGGWAPRNLKLILVPSIFQYNCHHAFCLVSRHQQQICFQDNIILWQYPGSEITPSRLPMQLKIRYWRPEFHSWLPAGDLSCGLSSCSKTMINIWNHEDICQQVSYVYFSSCWYLLIKSETNLPVEIPPQQLLSIRVESFQVAMVLSAEIR